MGQTMMMKDWGLDFLFDDLGPVAGLRIILGGDPDIGGHQLKHQHNEGCGKSNARENVEQPFLRIGFLVIHDLE